MFNLAKTLEEELKVAYGVPVHPTKAPRPDFMILDEIAPMKSKKLRIVAQFKGKDGSLGYRHGTAYALDCLINKVGDAGFTIMVSRPSQKDYGKMTDAYNLSTCPYATLDLFYENWNVADKYKAMIGILV